MSTGQPSGQPPDQGDLLEVLREQLEYMREQLNQERDANRENRRIIAGLVQRVPELEAASEQRESPQTSSEEQEKGTDHKEDRNAENPSWWRRFFGVE
jgi:hypothetical protein